MLLVNDDPDGRQAQILVSDVGMPDEDGFDLIRPVRQAGYTAQRLPAVVLTAFANKGPVESALLRGLQDISLEPAPVPTREPASGPAAPSRPASGE